MELIKFIFSSFWIFIGILILITVVLSAITEIVGKIVEVIILSKKLKHKNEEDDTKSN